MQVEDNIVKIFVEKREINFQHPDYELDTVSTTGSGFFIEKDIILTCYHVVSDSINIMISHRSLDKVKIPVDILKVFPDDDMALIKINRDDDADCIAETTYAAYGVASEVEETIVGIIISIENGFEIPPVKYNKAVN